MMLDHRDILVLRLAGKYRWLPFDILDRYNLASLADDIAMLAKTGYLGISRNKRYVKLMPKGYEYLDEHGYNYEVPAKRAYESSITLRRRLTVSEIMLTCLRAGIDVLQDHVDALREQPVFLPAFALRLGDINVMSNASCAGFGHWGNKAFMLHYVSCCSRGMYLINELSILHKLSSVFAPGFDTPTAMIFAGSGYRTVYDQVHDTVSSGRHGGKGFYDFSEVYKRADLPIHLLACDETGAKQLALMRQTDHNNRIAHVAFGGRWRPRDEALPVADGSVDGTPLVIAADMDIQRVLKVIAMAKRLNHRVVMVAAFKEQLEALLFEILPMDFVKALAISQPVLEAAFGNDFSLSVIDRGGTGHD